MSNIIIHSPATVELDKITYSKLYKLKNGSLKGKISYNHGYNLYIKGPKMTLGSDIIKQNGYYYVDLTFDKKNKHNLKFLELVKKIDYLAISEIHENSQLWYPDHNEDVSLIQIEQEYIPTIKLSTIYTDCSALKLKISENKTEFFDQDNIAVPYQLIKENYMTTPLFHVEATCKDDQYIWTQWELSQLKVELPETVISGCQLIDIDDESDNDDVIPTVEELEELNKIEVVESSNI